MAGSKKLMRVFISSIISGMEEFRDAAVRGARCLAHETIRAENFGAQADSPRNSCLAGVREADAVILLVGERYGTRQPSGLSATHEEYREAKERCPILVMVQDGVEREVSQTNFLNEVRDWTAGLYTASFTNADQLLDAVVRALHELEMAQNAGRCRSRSNASTRPCTPAEQTLRLLKCNSRLGNGAGRRTAARGFAPGTIG